MLGAKIASMDGGESIIQCVRNSDSLEKGVALCAEGLLDLLERDEENELFVSGGAELFALIREVSPNRLTQLSALRAALCANLTASGGLSQKKVGAAAGKQSVAA